jgi:hypothetical protein
MSLYHIIYKFLSVSDMFIINFCYQIFVFSDKCLFEILSVFLKIPIKLGQVSGSYLNPPLLGMTLNKNVLKSIGGEITDGILLNGDAQKIKVITGGEDSWFGSDSEQTWKKCSDSKRKQRRVSER